MKSMLGISALLCALCLAGPASAQVTVIDVSYSYPQIPNGEPPDQPEPWVVDGSVIATFSANNPIDLAAPDPDVHRVDAYTFETTFLWDWSAPKTVTFVDGLEAEIPVTAWPQPVIPLDPSNHDIPVVHIQTDSTGLWDPETGIYVWGNYANFDQRGVEWERPATMDYYDAAGVLQFTEPIGLRINGGSSRWEDQKPLRFYFDGYGATEQVVYDFFGEAPTSFRRLLARNARYSDKLLPSNWAEGLYRDLGHLGSRYVFTAFYVNGNYWGGYSLKERFDSQYVEHTYDLAADDYVLIKDNEAVHGDLVEWHAFMDSFTLPADCTSHAWFQDKADRMDLISYIDWLFINIFATTDDNGVWWNVANLKVGDGKWQYLMWDEDALMIPDNLNADFFRLFASGDETEYLSNMPPVWNATWWSVDISRWILVFNRLMLNSEFKALFSDRVDALLANEMSVGALIARMDDLVAEQQPEMAMHEQRWEDFSEAYYLQVAEDYRQFIIARHPVVVNQKADFMDEHRVPVELSRFSAEGGDGRVDLAWRTESETDNLGFVVYRSAVVPDNMVEIASYLTHPELVGQLDSGTPTEYVFTDTAVSNTLDYHYRLHHVETPAGEIVHDWVETAWPEGETGLVLNEFMAANSNTVFDEYAQFDDWFELYNGDAVTVYLDGLYVTDDLAQPTKHLLTGGLSIPPGERLLLWADNQTVQGPNHCAFQLSSDGEALALYASDGATLIDVLIFDRQFDDHSYARYPDGGPWSYAWYASPGTANREPRTDLFLRINEILAENVSINTDENGDHDPWVEIYNPLPVSVDMLGLTLTNDFFDPLRWAFPDVSIDGAGYLLVWGDDEPGQGPLHTNFWLDGSGDSVRLYNSDGVSSIDVVYFSEQSPDTSYVSLPDGADFWTHTNNPTPGAANQGSDSSIVLYINEYMASNDATVQDETGAYEDWCEIYNPGPAAVEMGGLHLTDDLALPAQWAFPATVLPAGGHLLVWCDNDPLDGPLHATFKLGAGGEEIGLFGRSGDGYPAIDIRVFGVQTPDVSEGRLPDGTAEWRFFFASTPAGPNSEGVGVDDDLAVGSTRIALYPSYPNPASGSTSLRFELPGAAAKTVSLEVYDLKGRRVRRLVRDVVSPGQHVVTWDRRDDDGRPAAAGAYFCRLVVGSERVTRKVLLVK